MKKFVDEKPLAELVTVSGDILPNTIPTQIANPKRASWRTFVQSAVAFLIGANIVLPIVSGFLVDNIDGLKSVLGPVYGYIVIGVNVAILVLSLGAKLVALLMANVTVANWIEAHLQFLAPIKSVDTSDPDIGITES